MQKKVKSVKKVFSKRKQEGDDAPLPASGNAGWAVSVEQTAVAGPLRGVLMICHPTRLCVTVGE